MRAPQIIFILLYAIGIGANAIQHGEPKQGTYNVWSSILGSSIGLSILWWGGFFG